MVINHGFVLNFRTTQHKKILLVFVLLVISTDAQQKKTRKRLMVKTGEIHFTEY